MTEDRADDLRTVAEKTLRLGAAATDRPWYLLTDGTEVASEHGDNGPIVIVDTRFFDVPTNSREREDAAYLVHAANHAEDLARAALALRAALAEAGIILEALNISVEWELHPSVKAEIARVVPLVRAALARAPGAGEEP